MTVADVGLSEIGFPEQRLAVALCVTNPNDEALRSRRATATLDVTGSELLSGATDAPVRLDPRSSTLVPFSVSATVANLGPQLLAVIGSGEVEYRVHGTVSIDGLPLPYARSGHLDALTLGLQAASSFHDVDPTSNACAPTKP